MASEMDGTVSCAGASKARTLGITSGVSGRGVRRAGVLHPPCSAKNSAAVL